MGIFVKEMIRESFVSCVITCATDGSQDDEIIRFKEDKPCHEGWKLLREQLQLNNIEGPNPIVIEDVNYYQDYLISNKNRMSRLLFLKLSCFFGVFGLCHIMSVLMQ